MHFVTEEPRKMSKRRPGVIPVWANMDEDDADDLLEDRLIKFTAFPNSKWIDEGLELCVIART